MHPRGTVVLQHQHAALCPGVLDRDRQHLGEEALQLHLAGQHPRGPHHRGEVDAAAFRERGRPGGLGRGGTRRCRTRRRRSLAAVQVGDLGRRPPLGVGLPGGCEVRRGYPVLSPTPPEPAAEFVGQGLLPEEGRLFGTGDRLLVELLGRGSAPRDPLHLGRQEQRLAKEILARMLGQGGEASPRRVDLGQPGGPLFLRGFRVPGRERETVPERELDRPDRSGQVVHHAAAVRAASSAPVRSPNRKQSCSRVTAWMAVKNGLPR